MFGLTRREQRWKAEQKAAETLVDLAKAFAPKPLTESDIRRIVREELERMNTVKDKSHT